MSFAQEFVDLLEKYEKKFEQVKELSITSLFGKDIIQPDSVKQLIYDLQYAADYNDSTVVYCDDEGEEYYAEDLSWSNGIEVDWENNLDAEFEKFASQAFHPELPEQHTQEAVEQGLELLLGSFYLGIIEELKHQLNVEYGKLKGKYPNQSFYPRAILNTDEVTYFESSKCW